MGVKRQPIEYRGYSILTAKDGEYVFVIDKYCNVCKKIDNYNHGSITEAKWTIDYMIKKINQTNIC